MNTSFDIEDFLKNLTHRPGVYLMLDQTDNVLYVGKAKDLKKRVSSYFRKQGYSTKTKLMLEQMQQIQVSITDTEADALLLENNLIKERNPRYNILLRDDKSYPYIRVTTQDEFPRLSFYRGSCKQSGRYFGPYPSAGAVRETLNLLCKLFQLRQCDNSFFKNRSRPCLQYQIKRCTAPCVGFISTATYRENLDLAVEFLSGNSRKIIGTLVHRMDQLSEQKKYEQASQVRDQIETLRQVTNRQHVSSDRGDLDIIAGAIEGGSVCVQVFNVRGGLSIGNKAHYPSLPSEDVGGGELLTAFIGQYYLTRKIPHQIVLAEKPDDGGSLRVMLEKKVGHQVQIITSPRGQKRQWLETAKKNASYDLKTHLASKLGFQKQLKSLRDTLSLPELPMRMECFDISHTMGEETVASCVVFGHEGAVKQEYRRFNIRNVAAGDDYAAMRQAVERRYRRLIAGEGKLPDILFIDGGKGQLNEALIVLQELGVQGVTVVAVAKGVERKPGLEKIFLAQNDQILLVQADDAALHLIQQIRDEAHRFAISGHRGRRAKKRRQSPLEELPGLGPKRRHNLIKYFGGIRGVSSASIEELSRVNGISQNIAESIYERLHIKNEN